LQISDRSFTLEQLTIGIERQDGICPACGRELTSCAVVGHHLIGWGSGGATSMHNLVVLYRKECHRLFDVLSAGFQGDCYVGNVFKSPEASQLRDPGLYRTKIRAHRKKLASQIAKSSTRGRR
jgi:hypothetical protein